MKEMKASEVVCEVCRARPPQLCDLDLVKYPDEVIMGRFHQKRVTLTAMLSRRRNEVKRETVRAASAPRNVAHQAWRYSRDDGD